MARGQALRCLIIICPLLFIVLSIVLVVSCTALILIWECAQWFATQAVAVQVFVVNLCRHDIRRVVVVVLSVRRFVHRNLVRTVHA